MRCRLTSWRMAEAANSAAALAAQPSSCSTACLLPPRLRSALMPHSPAHHTFTVATNTSQWASATPQLHFIWQWRSHSKTWRPTSERMCSNEGCQQQHVAECSCGIADSRLSPAALRC